MTGEIKEDMCGRKDCEICGLLNELFKEVDVGAKFDKYGELYYH